MKCSRCGADIPGGEIYCANCGYEVQIVPDYSPLDDVVTSEVKDSIDSYTRPIEVDERDYVTSEPRRNPADDRRTPEERKRQQIARRRQLQKKKKQQRLTTLVGVMICILIAVFVCYSNSYTGIVNSGENAVSNHDYSKALSKFNKAIRKNKARPEAYTGMAYMYKAQDEMKEAEAVFKDAIAGQPENVDLYEAAIDFYIDTNQMSKISLLLEDCSEKVLSGLGDYVSAPPEFSLAEGTFDEVQQVSLSSSEEKIYYTVNGTNPTTLDSLYKEPILLNEGENEVRAISVNKKGVPSVIVSKMYIIDIPVADAPAVTPSTGQYDTYTEIIIQVPEGYTAYYTMDNTDPTIESEVYTGPIEMPEGQTIFSAVLINGQGKMTQITKRNYVLEYEE